jgi:phosphopantothenoylcysteine decarboxylase/phosphopantothenate--cysteine ligase
MEYASRFPAAVSKPMTTLEGRHILLGVGGGIAAYKAPDLVRRLREAGARVRVVMTAGATEFVQPMTLQAVSGEAVRSSLWDAAAEAAMGHIELARWADEVVIAPATADLMARLAHGLADDLLTTLCLATEAPVSIAPAMNRVMWASAATQANLAVLQRRGVRVFGPGEGDQACGEVGSGRMWEPMDIVTALAGATTPGPLSGCRALVTAGPTREAIDPVRYVGNRSSGRMGFAVAAALARRGAAVTVIAGPTSVATPAGVGRVDVESAGQMLEAVKARLGECDLFVGAAAVADYRVATVAASKIKKDADRLTLELVRNPDILQFVADAQPRPFVVGFAAETEQVADNARGKLERKRLDLIAGNRVGVAGTGFDVERNALEVLWRDGRVSLPEADKQDLADALVEIISERYHAARQNPDT